MPMQREFYELKNKRAEKLAAAQEALTAKKMEDYSAIMGEVTNMNGELTAMENLLAEEGRFGDNDTHMLNLHQAIVHNKEEEQLHNAIDVARSGIEYTKAFADAIRNKVSPEMGRRSTAYEPLYNAMTIGGGTPEGSDGGFLVPIDFDNMIHLKKKEFVCLADYVNVENVNGYVGWRAVETTAGRKPLSLIEEAAEGTEDDEPTFIKVDYKIKKYGDFIPISNELMADNTAGLMQYLASWFAPRVVMTENSLILEILNRRTPKNLTTGKEIAELKSLLNRSLNTAISKNAIILTNGNSYDFLDQLEDKNGRPMLVPNPADPDVYRFKGRPVVCADSDLIPSRTVTTTGATKGDYDPIYVGCLKACVTLFRRNALEFAATNVGGKAWRTSTTEVKGIVRMDAQAVDKDAVERREIFTPAT